MAWSRHEPWFLLSLFLLFSLLILRSIPSPTGGVVKSIPGTLAYPPHVIDHRDAWKPALATTPAPTTQGDLVFVRNGYYVFEDGSYVADSNGNRIPIAPSNAITGQVIGEYFNNPTPQLMYNRYSPVVETCRDSDQTSQSISEERPQDGHNSYFQPGIVTMDVLQQRMIGDTVISQELVHGVQLQDRCFDAKDLGYENQPSYRGVVFEANCAVLRGLKNVHLNQAIEQVIGEDLHSTDQASLLKKFFTVQFCQKTTPLITSGSTQNVIQFVACGREGTQGYCQ